MPAAKAPESRRRTFSLRADEKSGSFRGCDERLTKERVSVADDSIGAGRDAIVGSRELAHPISQCQFAAGWLDSSQSEPTSKPFEPFTSAQYNQPGSSTTCRSVDIKLGAANTADVSSAAWRSELL